MDCCDDRSACRRSTALFPLVVVISLRACSPLARSRQTITTVAPLCASASAVAFPIPELAPVTMQIYEVGSQRVTSTSRLGRVFPKRSLLLSDSPARPTSARFQLPLPEPCRRLSQHTALQ